MAPHSPIVLSELSTNLSASNYRKVMVRWESHLYLCGRFSYHATKKWFRYLMNYNTFLMFAKSFLYFQIGIERKYKNFGILLVPL